MQPGGYIGYDLLITMLRGLLALPFLLMGWYLAKIPKGLVYSFC